MNKPFRLYPAAGLIFLIMLSGCSSLSTRSGFYKPITAELHKNNFAAAVAGMEAARDKFGSKDRFVYYMDAGLAYHYAGIFDSSNNRLSNAEQTADELYTKSISRGALSMVLNDNVLEYSGEDYEVLYTNLIMALNYIKLNKFDDAFVEIKRANEKLDLLEQKYRKLADGLNAEAEQDTLRIPINYEAGNVRFNNDAFARYLSMHLYAADGKPDDAQLDRDFLTRAFVEQENIYPFPQPEISYNASNKAVLSVVALAGMSAVKEALNLRVRTDKQLKLIQISYVDGEMKGLPYYHFPADVDFDLYFKLSIPQIIDRPSAIDHINVYSGAERIGQLQLLEDVGLVSRAAYDAKKPIILMKTLARSLAKAIVNYKAKKKVDEKKKSTVGGWLGKLAVDVLTDLSENADIRCSRLLPGRIFVGDFELEPGTYDLTVEFVDAYGNVLSHQTYTDYQVMERGLNFIEAVSMN